MTGPEHDAELEAFLKRRSPMYRRLSDIDHAEPSLEIDRLVLSRAREAIETPSQPPMYRTTRWALPVGLAATILIAFTVVLNIDRHGSNAAKPVASSATPAAEAAARPQAAEAPVARAAPVSESARVDQPHVLSDSAVAAPQAADGAATAAETQAGAAAAPDPRATAESWLREIKRLRAAGKTADADRELVAFRQAYPTHPAYSVAKPPAR